MKRKINANQGITLMSLIITIIIMLILAGVVLNLTIGERGIFKTAQNAGKNYTNASKQELAELDNLDNELQKITGGTGEDAGNSFRESLDEFKLPTIQDGEIVKTIKVEGKERTIKPKTDYGRTVSVPEYNSELGGNLEGWKLLYVDEEKNNVYLMAQDFATIDKIPTGKEGMNVYEEKTSNGPTGRYSFTHISSNSTYSSKWIFENSKAKVWLKEWFNYNYGIFRTQEKNDAYGINAVAYLLDTDDEVWGKYVDKGKADYCIGSPTIELMCASYKDSHPKDYVACWIDGQGANGGFGYEVSRYCPRKL